MLSTVVLVILCWCICHSDSAISLDIKPPIIEVGFANNLVVECSISGDSSTGAVYIDSIIISKNMPNSSDAFKEMAAINAVFGSVVELSSENATVTGVINDNLLSYLRLTWTDPSYDRAGMYKCEASGIDKIGHHYGYMSVSNVTTEEPDIDLFIKEMEYLKETVNFVEDLQDYQDSLWAYLENSKQAFFHISTTFNGSKYCLSSYPGDVNSFQAQAVCQLYGGYLAEIDTPDEHAFIKSFIVGLTSQPNTGFILISGTDVAQKGIYLSTETNKPVGYIKFGSGYPVNTLWYDCLYLYSSINWDMLNFPCIQIQYTPRFLCEMPEVER